MKNLKHVKFLKLSINKVAKVSTCLPQKYVILKVCTNNCKETETLQILHIFCVGRGYPVPHCQTVKFDKRVTTICDIWLSNMESTYLTMTLNTGSRSCQTHLHSAIRSTFTVSEVCFVSLSCTLQSPNYRPSTTTYDL